MILIPTLLLSATALAPQGPLADMPMGVMSPGATELQRIDEGGSSQSLAIDHPQYARTALLGPVVAASDLTFGSISRGHGNFSTVWQSGDPYTWPIHETPPGGWAWLLFTVSQESKGAPGSIIRDSAGPGLNGRVFGRITPGSVAGGIPADDTGEVVQVWSDAQTPGLGAIEGIDSSLAALPLGDGIPDEYSEEFYFTLRGTDFALIPDSWRFRHPSGSPATGAWRGAATIFYIKQSGPTSWTVPKVFQTREDLNLPVMIDGAPVEIDGLSVMEPGMNTEILLSCAGTSSIHQLWVVGEYETDNGPKRYEGPLRATNGFPFPIVYMGVEGTDDLKSLCSEDPGHQGNSYSSLVERRRMQYWGLPQVYDRAIGRVDFNAHRVKISGSDYYRIHLYKELGEVAELFATNPQSSLDVSLGFFGGANSTSVRVLIPVPRDPQVSGSTFGYRWELSGGPTTRRSHYRNFYWENN